MNLLALETATGLPGLCLRTGAGAVYTWQGEARPGPRRILAAANDLFEKAGLRPRELDAVACGRGPGAFTGVRLGIALAQGFAMGADCVVVSVSELQALAYRACREHCWQRVVAMLDARQGEIYMAAYDCSKPRPLALGAEQLLKPANVRLAPGEWGLAGPGAALIGRKPHCVDSGLLPTAEALADLALRGLSEGEGVAPAAVAPVYLRERVAVSKPGRLK